MLTSFTNIISLSLKLSTHMKHTAPSETDIVFKLMHYIKATIQLMSELNAWAGPMKGGGRIVHGGGRVNVLK